MITFVLNAVGWTFNKDAVADVWFEDQRSMVMDDDQSSTGHDYTQSIPNQDSCNHWCHSVGHFIGLFSQSAPVIPESADECFIQQSLAIQLLSPDGLFRPPRLLS